jgi:uncharacterized protein YxjI
MLDSRFQYDRYMIRKKLLKLFGGAFHIYNPAGEVVFYTRLKAFRLKEDLRVYASEAMTKELLTIKARQVLDFGATYDVSDPETGELVGGLRRKGLRSTVRDEWRLLDPSGNEIGLIQEDSISLALLRRFATSLIPQTFTGAVSGVEVLSFRRHFNPFVLRMDMDFSGDAQGLLDRRLGIAAGILIGAIEGRQSD